MKTLIEFFDSENINNVTAYLHMSDIGKIVFIGTPYVMNKKAFECASRILKKYGNPEIEKIMIPSFDFNYTVDAILKSIKNENCIADATGGTEIALVAAGSICSRENIPLHIFTQNRFVPLLNYSSVPATRTARLSVSDIVMLNGGMVRGFSQIDDFSPDFEKDLEKLWQFSIKNPRDYSRVAFELSKFNPFFIKSDIEAELPQLMFKGITGDKTNEAVLNALQKSDFLSITANGTKVKIRFKNKRIKTILTRVGELLEILVYYIAQKSKYFDDVRLSVCLDWNTGSPSIRQETSNEVDAVFTKECTAYFISCKNCPVKKEYLYELQTVAEQFGGKSAKQVLITSYPVEPSVENRALDMNINLIHLENAVTLSDFEREFLRIFKF